MKPPKLEFYRRRSRDSGQDGGGLGGFSQVAIPGSEILEDGNSNWSPFFFFLE